MSKFIPSFEERMSNPHLGIINFREVSKNVFLAQIEVRMKLFESFQFKNDVNLRLDTNLSFRKNFQKYFPKIYDELLEAKQQNILNKKSKQKSR